MWNHQIMIRIITIKSNSDPVVPQGHLDTHKANTSHPLRACTFECLGNLCLFEHAPVPIETFHYILEHAQTDRKSTRLNSSHQIISYAVFCLKKKINWKSIELKYNILSWTSSSRC